MGSHISLAREGATPIDAWSCPAPGAPRGGVVVVQEIFGVNEHIRAVTERFAAAGYSALAPDFFGRVEAGVELGYDRAGYNRARGFANRVDMETEVVPDVAAAAALLAPAGKVAVVGYCWGGTVAFLAALRLALPAISFYGSRNVRWLGEPARAPLQFHFGERDPHIPPEVVEQHRQAYPEAELYTYPAGHGFNCDLRADFVPESSALAWERSLDFLARHVG